MIRILIADDEYAEQRLLKKTVTEYGKENVAVNCVGNGRDAVNVASLWNADIILMDIEMPGLSGIEAARKIIAGKPSVKIIFVTAYDLFEYAKDALKLGAVDYIVKPVDKEDVIRAVKQAADRVKVQRQLEGASLNLPLLEKGGGTNQLIAKVRDYIRHNYSLYDLSLDSVSDILKINPSYLSALFKKSTGVNFIDYVADVRTAAAKNLLKDPLRPASEIASMVGYESASYFTRAFKKKTGMTPTEYRRSVARSGGSSL